MDVFWLEAAVADVEEIVAHIEADNPAAALPRLLRHIDGHGCPVNLSFTIGL